jgi:DHA3 family macrolide efflux protein-like MFS transporter
LVWKSGTQSLPCYEVVLDKYKDLAVCHELAFHAPRIAHYDASIAPWRYSIVHTTDTTATTGRVAYGRLFGNRSFVALWLGQTISFLGDYFNWLAVPIMVERLTGSALMVGLSVMSNTLPMLLLGPIAGVFVDRWDRKWTMVVSDLLRAALVLMCLLVRTADQVWIYYVVGFLMSCVSRFFFPAQNAMLPLIVPDKDDLLAANGLMQTVQTVGMLAGGALAGFLIGLLGEQVAFVIDSATYVVSAAAITTMAVLRTTKGQQAAGGQLAAVWAEIRDGVVYLFGSRTMVGVLICLSVVQLGVGALQVVWVPYLERTFGVGAEGLGIVDSIQGAGMIVGGVAMGFLTARMSKTAMIAWGLGLIGPTLCGMGLAPAFGYVVVCSFALGVLLVPMQSALMTIMQLAVPDLMRGRVGSAQNALTMAAGMISMGGAAVFGELAGLRTVYLMCGLIISSAGLLGIFVLEEPEPVEGEI